MWQHEILADMQSAYNNQTNKKTLQAISLYNICELLKKTQAIYFGSCERYTDLFKNNSKEFVDKNEFWAFKTLPFNILLIEYSCESTRLLAEGEVYTPYRANLVIVNNEICQHNLPTIKGITDKKEGVFIFEFWKPKDNRIKFSWYPSPMGVYAIEPQNLQYVPLSKDLYDIHENYKNDFISLEKDIIIEVGLCHALIDLVNCKNISLERVVPPLKLNKKREKNGKLPLYEYKIVKINKGVVKQKTSKIIHCWGNIPHSSDYRLHLTRGHFKEYTKDAPLFGKYTGRFWWQPQVRGNKENGIIVKDYEVITQ